MKRFNHVSLTDILKNKIFSFQVWNILLADKRQATLLHVIIINYFLAEAVRNGM